MSDYESIIAISAIIFCWVMMPICYYIGFRDGKNIGFKRGLPFGALAWLEVEKETEARRVGPLKAVKNATD